MSTDINRFALCEHKGYQGTDDVIVGNAFAFLTSGALSKNGLGWVNRLFSKAQEQQPQIISLMGDGPIDLMGLTIQPLNIEKLELECVTSDKTLYRAGRDSINLLLIRPSTPNSTAAVALRTGGVVFSRHSIKLGPNGAGQLQLRDLPVGDYEVAFDDKADSCCQFVVAEYRLVPLVASMTKCDSTENGQLDVTLHIESFGTALDGEVKISLQDRNQVLSSQKCLVSEGGTAARFQLQGEGPHTLAVQVISDPAKTATVPLRGSRKTERTTTVFSPLGIEIGGSLLPSDNAALVRGIYLSEVGVKTSPISLSRVDGKTARFTLNDDVSVLKIVAVDPTFPKPAIGAVDVRASKHPDSEPGYKEAVKDFEDQNFAHAREMFEAIRQRFTHPHPYFAYWIACCHARTGQTDKALSALRQSLVDGWTELAHMKNDDDLASVREHPEFETLLSGGLKELTFSDLPAGQTIDIDTTGPSTLFLLGAFLDDKVWEGWATMIRPSDLTAKVMSSEKWKPGDFVSVDVDLSDGEASVYVIVKDARLISADTAELRLASAIKEFVEINGKNLSVGRVTRTVRTIVNDMPHMRYRGSATAAPWGSGSGGSGLFGTFSLEAEQMETGSWGAFPGAGGVSPPAGMMKFSGSSQPALRQQQASTPPAMALSARDMSTVSDAASFDQAAKPTSAATLTKPKTFSAVWDEPEVLFAGFVPVEKCKAKFRVKLPDVFADYIVECFVVSGMDWASQEVRFQAVKDPFVQLTTPVFVKAGQPSRGFLHVGSSSHVAVKLLHDGQPVSLFMDNGQPGGSINGGQVTMLFEALPGQYEAIVEVDGATLCRASRQVLEPGRLKRMVRTISLLREGDSLDINDFPGARALSLQPGIDSSFELLVEATADYQYCCCEQTAAKLISGCAMYMFSEDEEKRKAAESVILAGIRREKQMWLRGKGFKSYPDRPNLPDLHYGPKAARYLWNLKFLYNNRNSSDLRAAIDEGLSMAQDASTAYKIDWPPKNMLSAEDAYGVACFSEGRAKDSLAFVKQLVNGKNDLNSFGQDPYLGGKVFQRKEAAYAAATLIRCAATSDLTTALKLCNMVINDFNEQGRLYSTCDSVAAIALMSELKRSGITQGGGSIEINGRKMSIEEALSTTEHLISVKAMEGIAAVAVDKMIEEDWTKLSSTIATKITLETNGQHSRRLAVGNSVDLVVRLEEGYQMGDLLWVALPDALSRVVGGGQVKLFSIDFAGESELRITLAATGVTDNLQGQAGEQSLAVCVRNMFQEERVGSPGLIPISVSQ
ncbi:MAG: hypothetical protein K2X93_17080 [Candidatus Obscuribacterales bacterium]|nr:hypothetical protein [Candidatus Obscuribacterales bacterium]